MYLTGKSALVTGGGRGIGRAVALRMAAEGAAVVVMDPGVGRDGRGAEGAPASEVAEEILAAGGQAVPCHEPVDDHAAAERAVHLAVEAFGRLDIVVNCAGVLRERMIWNLTEDDWDTVIRVHLKGHYNINHHASKLMRSQQSGRIINFSSDAWRGSVGQVNYAAAKGGIVSMTRGLARELGRYGVTSNAICPMAATRMTLNEGVIAGMKKRLEAGLITPERFAAMQAMPGPEYVAPFVAYLASDHAAHINGQVFHVEKGRVSIYSEPVEERALYKQENDGHFTLDDLIAQVPQTLLNGYHNPAPRESQP